MNKLSAVLGARGATTEPEKTIMPTVGKCYIVLRTFAF